MITETGAAGMYGFTLFAEELTTESRWKEVLATEARRHREEKSHKDNAETLRARRSAEKVRRRPCGG
jgi:hypothetical protein